MAPRSNLSQRFAFIIFSVGLLLVIPLVGLQTYNARVALQERVQASSAVIADALESLVRAHLEQHDLPVLAAELKELVAHNRMAYVDVFDTQGRPLIRVANAEHPRGNSRDPRVQDVKDSVLDLNQTVGGPTQVLGQLDVGIWVGGLGEDIRRIAWNGVWMGLSLCLCLALISWGLGRWLSGRIRRFAEDLASRTPQDYRHLDLKGEDELSALGDAFNQLQDRLKEAQDRRDRAERERQDMIQMIIHDLKGPLGGFAVGLDLLKESVEASKDSSQIQTLELMERATDRLLRMTQSILQFARLQDPSTSIRRSAVSLKGLLTRRMDETQLSAHDLGVTLQLIGPSQSDAIVNGDPDLLGRVVENLIFNALEHTPRGGYVQIVLREKSNEFLVEIRDSGPGVPDEEKATIFEKFKKGQQPSRGVGLGLAFCKLAVERHGGHIGVTDAPEGGAIFYFTLPAEPQASFATV